MFNKSFVKIVLVGGGNFLNAVLGFAFLSATAKVLDLSTFGKYALLTTLLTTISKVTDFGTNSVFVAGTTSDDDQKAQDAFFTLRIILTLISIPLGLICLWIFGLNDLVLVSLFVLGLIFYAINYTLYALFQKQEKFGNLVALNSISAGIKGTFAALVFLKVIDLNLENSFAIFSLSLLSSCFLVLNVPDKLKVFKFNPGSVKSLLKSATPAGISQFINEAWPTISNAIAKFAKGFADVGVFSLANKISNIFSLISLSIFAVLLPKNARRKRENLNYDIKETAIISIGVIILAVCAIFIAELFLSKMFGDKFADSIKILDVLIFASALSSIQAFMENYFFVEDKTHVIMYVNVLKLAGFVILAILLTSMYSLMGLAWANFISSAISLLVVFSFIAKSSARQQQ